MNQSNIFSLLTKGVVEFIITAAIYAIVLYFLWNLCLSVELGLPQYSYVFFGCLVSFVKILFHNSNVGMIRLEAVEFYKKFNSLNNLVLFEVSRQLVKDGVKNANDIKAIMAKFKNPLEDDKEMLDK
jgi:hypothetical protein